MLNQLDKSYNNFEFHSCCKHRHMSCTIKGGKINHMSTNCDESEYDSSISAYVPYHSEVASIRKLLKWCGLRDLHKVH
jgi:hypothetical protein